MKIKSAFVFLKKMFRTSKSASNRYYKKYQRYAFAETKCKDEYQFEASIIKMYHAVEKGLSYVDYRPGFGRKNIDNLILSLEQYSRRYDTQAFFYETALSVLHEYVRKNKEVGLVDEELEQKINSLPGKANQCGGIIDFLPYQKNQNYTFADFIKSRHSMRHFSDVPVDFERIVKALETAQHTPSACNRHGWRSWIILERDALQSVLANQNGNRGFGQEISALIVVTGDLRCFNRGRELHQVFIDGGMYAMNVLHGLHDEGLASVPLSASLFEEQDKNTLLFNHVIISESPNPAVLLPSDSN